MKPFASQVPGMARALTVLLLLFAATAQAQIQRISTAVDGTEANHDSYEASVSDDGNVIAFRSSL